MQYLINVNFQAEQIILELMFLIHKHTMEMHTLNNEVMLLTAKIRLRSIVTKKSVNYCVFVFVIYDIRLHNIIINAFDERIMEANDAKYFHFFANQVKIDHH